jgi:hypothetical protein
MHTALFEDKPIKLLDMELSATEKSFLEAINMQRSSKVPFIPINRMDVTNRQMWRAALEGNFKGLKVLMVWVYHYSVLCLKDRCFSVV